LDQVLVGRLQVDLAEIQVLAERRVERAEDVAILRGQAGHRDAVGRQNVDRDLPPLAFIADEEVRDVLDDWPAQRDAELLVLRGDFGDLGGEDFGRATVAQILVGEVEKALAMELVGARLGARDDRDRADLVQLRLVVRRQHLILADRELRERVARRAVLPGQAAAQHVILLADAIDEDVDRVRSLRTALDTLDNPYIPYQCMDSYLSSNRI
ncbi:hypothetical protein COLO4_01397, partial [Corchorus olitorius]